jgi:conserved hypothetical protein TIGR01655
MKKILIALLAVLILIFGGSFALVKITYGGPVYYVQIKEDGKVKNTHFANGETVKRYDYSINGYNSKGEVKVLNFDADHNLRHEAYLKLTYNKNKGVTKWEEVEKSKIPQKAFNRIKN